MPKSGKLRLINVFNKYYGISMSLFNSVLSAAASLGLGKDQKEQASLLPALIQVVNQYPGGITGLMQAFQQGGLGAIVSSWMGQGQNLPVEPNQLQQVLGSSMVNELVQKSGLDQSAVLGHLSTLLPVIVDKVFSSPADADPATASAQAPTQLDVTSLMTSVLGMLSKK